MFVINYRKIFLSISAILVALSVFAIFFFGLNFGIDFKGGSITEVSYPTERPTLNQVEESINSLGLSESLIQPIGEDGFLVRTQSLKEEERLSLINALSLGKTVELKEERFNSIGPVVGEEMKSKAWVAIFTVIFAIILFIAFIFRHVSEPVSSWKYGLVAIVALIHDIIIPTGIFAFLGSMFIEAQIDVLFVTALLAILGFSINDTIVVFDRIRENLRINLQGHIREEFSKTVGKSLRQTFARSINTSMTTLFVLLALYFFGPETTKNFTLVLSIGLIAGTYSSIFLASPLLVVIERFSSKRN